MKSYVQQIFTLNISSTLADIIIKKLKLYVAKHLDLHSEKTESGCKLTDPATWLPCVM